MFSKIFKQVQISPKNTDQDFDYLEKNSYYFDSSCQTLRPSCVILAEESYYKKHNSCGQRVKYPWGETTDEVVADARNSLLKFIGKSPVDYFVVFTLNTTYGINLILNQLKPDNFKTILVSDIDHNSVFVPSIVWSQKNDKPRIVLTRKDDGYLEYSKRDLSEAIVITNTTSNIDGRELINLKQLSKDVTENQGCLLLDCCQTFSTNPALLQGVDFDVAFGSGHKMYAPSLGFMVIKKSFVKNLNPTFLGGGTVKEVNQNSFKLIDDPQNLHQVFEPGLANYAGITGFVRALKWLEEKKSDKNPELLGNQIFSTLKEIPGINFINQKPSKVLSLWFDKIDSHQAAIILGQLGIMVRSGYFCCHYFLQYQKKLPPILRISTSYSNTASDTDFLIKKIIELVKAY